MILESVKKRVNGRPPRRDRRTARSGKCSHTVRCIVDCFAIDENETVAEFSINEKTAREIDVREKASFVALNLILSER